MWPGTANSGGWRSPQASAGTPNNTGELAQIDKKKPQLITVGASVLVEAAGIEPASESPSATSPTSVVGRLSLARLAPADRIAARQPEKISSAAVGPPHWTSPRMSGARTAPHGRGSGRRRWS